jgi:hypothetical protein
MPLSQTEAQGALRDISTAERASAKAYGYRLASPHLIVWGVVWILGYGVSYTRPEWSAAWPVLALAGSIASFWIGWSNSCRTTGMKRDWRGLGTAAAIFAYVAAILIIMPPRTDAQAGAFFPILVALFYTLVGIWMRGTRMLIAGVAVAALTLGGYFLLPHYFLLWMAVVGGGALILGGIWLRNV